MKKIRNLVSIVLIILLLVPSFIFADSPNALKMAEGKVESLDVYREYANEIKSVYVTNETYTEHGYRATISYNLTDVEGEKILIFVLDENSNVLYSGLNEMKDSELYLTDLSSKTTERITLSSYNDCTTEVCKTTRNRVSYDPTPGCSLIIGQACNSLIGLPILKGVCKAGVWIGCNISLDKICTSSVTYPVCEY